MVKGGNKVTPLNEDPEEEGAPPSPVPVQAETPKSGGGGGGTKLAALTSQALAHRASLVQVACKMEFGVDVANTTETRKALQRAIAAELYLGEDSIKNFFAFQNGKNKLNKGSSIKIEIWKWNVSFDVYADLSEVTYSTPEKLCEGMGKLLSGQDFATSAAELMGAKKVIVIPTTLECTLKEALPDAPTFQERMGDSDMKVLEKFKRAARRAGILATLKNPTDNYCIIQWETAAFYTYESEIGGEPIPVGAEPPPFTAMSVGLSRLGASTGRSTIHWKTFDMSAKAGVNYVEQKPTQVFFDIGETHKDVIVKILPNQVFKVGGWVGGWQYKNKKQIYVFVLWRPISITPSFLMHICPPFISLPLPTGHHGVRAVLY